jgi:hypothetical protein
MHIQSQAHMLLSLIDSTALRLQRAEHVLTDPWSRK